MLYFPEAVALPKLSMLTGEPKVKPCMFKRNTNDILHFSRFNENTTSIRRWDFRFGKSLAIVWRTAVPCSCIISDFVANDTIARLHPWQGQGINALVEVRILYEKKMVRKGIWESVCGSKYQGCLWVHSISAGGFVDMTCLYLYYNLYVFNKCQYYLWHIMSYYIKDPLPIIQVADM